MNIYIYIYLFIFIFISLYFILSLLLLQDNCLQRPSRTYPQTPLGRWSRSSKTMVNHRRENIRGQHTGPLGTGQHHQTDASESVKIKSQGFHMTLHQPALVDQPLIEHACLEVSLMPYVFALIRPSSQNFSRSNSCPFNRFCAEVCFQSLPQFFCSRAAGFGTTNQITKGTVT